MGQVKISKKTKNSDINFWAILSKQCHSLVLLHGCLLYLQRLQPLLCIKGKGGPFSWFYVATRYTIVHTTTYSASTLRVPHTQDVIFMQDLSGLDENNGQCLTVSTACITCNFDCDMHQLSLINLDEISGKKMIKRYEFASHFFLSQHFQQTTLFCCLQFKSSKSKIFGFYF